MKKIILYLLTLSMVVVLATGCSTTEAGSENDNATEVVKSQGVEAFGVVVAPVRKNIVVDFPAVVEEILVQEGEKVEKDDVIMTLDLTEYQAQIENKERELQISRWELERTNGTTLRKMQKERVAALELELSLLEEKLARAYIADGNVIADFATGIIVEIGYQSGDRLAPSAKVFSVLEIDDLAVEANIFEEFIKDVELGAMVTIVPLADKTKEYQGTVTAISATAVKQNGETVVPIRISIEDNDGFLKPSFNVDVLIDMK